jgi:hypothetical protein
MRINKLASRAGLLGILRHGKIEIRDTTEEGMESLEHCMYEKNYDDKEFQFTNVEFNVDGSALLLWGEHNVATISLPVKPMGLSRESVDWSIKSVYLKYFDHGASSPCQLICARWHPESPFHVICLLLFSGSFYLVIRHIPSQFEEEYNLGSIQNEKKQNENFTSFTFGPNSGYFRHSLFLVSDTGNLYCIYGLGLNTTGNNRLLGPCRGHICLFIGESESMKCCDVAFPLLSSDTRPVVCIIYETGIVDILCMSHTNTKNIQNISNFEEICKIMKNSFIHVERIPLIKDLPCIDDNRKSLWSFLVDPVFGHILHATSFDIACHYEIDVSWLRTLSRFSNDATDPITTDPTLFRKITLDGELNGSTIISNPLVGHRLFFMKKDSSIFIRDINELFDKSHVDFPIISLKHVEISRKYEMFGIGKDDFISKMKSAKEKNHPIDKFTDIQKGILCKMESAKERLRRKKELLEELTTKCEDLLKLKLVFPTTSRNEYERLDELCNKQNNLHERMKRVLLDALEICSNTNSISIAEDKLDFDLKNWTNIKIDLHEKLNGLHRKSDQLRTQQSLVARPSEIAEKHAASSTSSSFKDASSIRMSPVLSPISTSTSSLHNQSIILGLNTWNSTYSPHRIGRKANLSTLRLETNTYNSPMKAGIYAKTPSSSNRFNHNANDNEIDNKKNSKILRDEAKKICSKTLKDMNDKKEEMQKVLCSLKVEE